MTNQIKWIEKKINPEKFYFAECLVRIIENSTWKILFHNEKKLMIMMIYDEIIFAIIFPCFNVSFCICKLSFFFNHFFWFNDFIASVMAMWIPFFFSNLIWMLFVSFIHHHHHHRDPCYKKKFQWYRKSSSLMIINHNNSNCHWKSNNDNLMDQTNERTKCFNKKKNIEMNFSHWDFLFYFYIFRNFWWFLINNLKWKFFWKNAMQKSQLFFSPILFLGSVHLNWIKFFNRFKRLNYSCLFVCLSMAIIIIIFIFERETEFVLKF